MNDTFLLVRHANSAVDFSRPAASWGLSAKGLARCQPLAQQLAPYRPTAVFTSTEPKAQQTGAAIAETLGIGWQTAVNLHEHDRSNIRDMSNEQFQANVARLFTDPDTLFFGRESGSQARHRFGKAVTAVLASRPQEQIAIVAHGTVITLLLAAANPIDPVTFWRSLTMPCFMLVERDSFRLQTAVCHLP